MKTLLRKTVCIIGSPFYVIVAGTWFALEWLFREQEPAFLFTVVTDVAKDLWRGEL